MDFFILGNPRSGTTLLRLMLNSHPEIGVPPESGFLQWWHKKYNLWSVAATQNEERLTSFIEDILSSKKIEDWKLNKEELKFFIISENPKKYIEIINCIYKFYTKNKPIIGDKNNYYIHHLSELKVISPQSKYIHLIRDGRDVACSYINIKTLDPNLKYIPKVSSNIAEIAREWDDNVSKIETFIAQENSITVKYEDLISSPENVLIKICEFLGVKFNVSMLNYHQNNNNDEPTSTLHWKKKTLEAIDSNNKQKFLGLLSTHEIDTFNAIALITLKKYNYE